MEVRNQGIVRRDRSKSDNLAEMALGLVSTQSFPAIVGCADAMLKEAKVILVGYEKTGSGHCTAVVRGKIADVRIAVEAGSQNAEKFGQLVSKSVIARPQPNLEVVLPIGSRLLDIAQVNHSSRLSNQAIGLLETRGFPAMVGAADAMLKAANVQLASYETTGGGLCTAIIRGAVADVVVAVEAGMYEAERIGQLNAVMVIPRPLDDLEQTLPVASCWLEERKPVMLPVSIKEREKQLLKLPHLQEKLEPSKQAELEMVELPDLKKLKSQNPNK